MSEPTQNVVAHAGTAVGVIGADLHFHGPNGPPVYLLSNFRPPPPADPDWLRELPSRMLDARHAVVPFVGRDAELAELRTWRDSPVRLAVRWLYAPGGQGKTRLAAELARRSARHGWKVVRAVHGAGVVFENLPREDLRTDGTVGLLLLVDYADRWPFSDLTWLFNNALLDRPGLPTRVLLLARSLDSWPSVRSALGTRRASTSGQALASLLTDDDSRATMFRAATDSFADRYPGVDATRIAPPPLDDPAFGLTLTLHSAALVAVDAAASNASAELPADPVGLTRYLLDREYLHWQNLYADGTRDTFRTSPRRLQHAVYLATLSGPMSRAAGVALAEKVGLDATALDDHAVCYPSAEGGVLEPLYPDRLGEDFLALTVEGHGIDYPHRPWAVPTVRMLLDAVRPTRAVSVLVAAAERWPHLAEECLYPLLHEFPELALAGGSTALTTLAGYAPSAVLEAVDAVAPDHSVDLDVGTAVVAARLFDERVAATDDPGRQAYLYSVLSYRYGLAGDGERALDLVRRSVELHRRAARTGNPIYRGRLAMGLHNLANLLVDFARYREALPPLVESNGVRRGLVESGDLTERRWLALGLTLHASVLARTGRGEDAIPLAQEAVETARLAARDQPGAVRHTLAAALNNLGTVLADTGRIAEAVAPTEEAGELFRLLVDAEPDRYLPEFALWLANLGQRYAQSNRFPDALLATTEAIGHTRRLAETNPVVHEPALTRHLRDAALFRAALHDGEGAVSAAAEAVVVARRLVGRAPDVYGVDLVRGLLAWANGLATAGRPADALEPSEEAVAAARRLVETDAPPYEAVLAAAEANLAALRQRAAH